MKHIITFFSLLFAISLNAQEIKTYSGVFESGKATYQYYENEKADRFYSGSFSYVGNPYTVNGKFYENLPVGKWKISALNKIYKNDKNRIQLTTSISGNYKSGNLDSTWNYSNSIKTYNPKTKKFNPKAQKIVGKAMFKDKHFIGSISLQFTSATTENITGQFDENGYPTGSWIKKSKLQTEEWRFENGVMIFHMIKNNATGDKLLEEDKATYYKEIWANYDPKKNLSVVGDKLYFLDTLEFHNEALDIWQHNVLTLEGFGQYINPFLFYQRNMQTPTSYTLIFIECDGKSDCYANYIKLKNVELEAQKQKEFEEAEKLRLEALAKEEQERIERQKEIERKRLEKIALAEKSADKLMKEKKYKAAYKQYIDINSEQFSDKRLQKIRQCEAEINRIDSLHFDLTNKFTFLKNHVEPSFKVAYSYDSIVRTKRKTYATNYIKCIDYLKSQFMSSYRTFSIEQTQEELEKWDQKDEQLLVEIEKMVKELELVDSFAKAVQDAIINKQKARLRILNSSLNPKVIIEDFMAYKKI